MHSPAKHNKEYTIWNKVISFTYGTPLTHILQCGVHRLSGKIKNHLSAYQCTSVRLCRLLPSFQGLAVISQWERENSEVGFANEENFAEKDLWCHNLLWFAWSTQLCTQMCQYSRNASHRTMARNIDTYKRRGFKKKTHTQIVCFNQSFVLHVYHIGFYIILFKSLPPPKMLCLLICICIILFRQYFAWIYTV